MQNTRFIQIHVIDDTPSEAAKLADSIAEKYHDRTTEVHQHLFDQEIKSLEYQWHTSEEKTRAAQDDLEKRRIDLKISDSTASSNSPATAPYFEAKRAFEKLCQDQNLLKTRIERLTDAPSPFQASDIQIFSSATQPARLFRRDDLGGLMAGVGLLLVMGGVVCLRGLQS